MLDSIKNALGECKYSHRTVCQSNSSYERVNDEVFQVFDPIDEDERPCRIVYNESTAQLLVTNTSGESIDFIKLDHCLIDTNERKCDCILMNSSKLFLIEIKNSASGSRSTKRREAVNQLGNTIDLLKRNSIQISERIVKAIICFKHSTTRPTQPSMNTKKAFFLEEYGVYLEEGNSIEF